MTTEQLEAVEDKIDDAVASERLASWEAQGRPELATLYEVAEALGVDLKQPR